MKILLQFLLITTLIAPGASSTTFANPAHIDTIQQKEQVFYKGSPKIKKVALTFDDGPDTFITKEVLDILKKENVHATFFVVGMRIKRNPQVFKRIVQEGHLIANHTWDHPILPKLSNHEIQRQVQKTNQLIEQLTGKRPLFFRPPYGDTNTRVLKALQSEGLYTIKWNIDTKDWKGPSSNKILQSISSRIVPGSIILQHSAGNRQKLGNTVRALPEIIHFLKRKNYQIVTLDQLLHTSAYQD